MRDIFETRDHPFARAYIQSLYPAYRADPQRPRAVAPPAVASSNGSLPTLTRQLTEHADELDRQIKVRAFAEQG